MNTPYFQDLTFSFPQKPSTHRRPDTGVWPCTLDGCTKVFAREADLKRHQRTTKSHSVPGSGVGSPCPLCDATFTRSDAMRRHLKSRHNGKTPETITLQDLPGTSSTRGKHRACSPSTTELSESDGDQPGDNEHCRSLSMARSRPPSVAPPYYVPPQAQQPQQQQNNLSPAILYHAAMSYEIRHALLPTSPRQNHSQNQNQAQNQAQHSSRREPYPQPSPQPGYQQFPADDYTSYPQPDQQQEQEYSAYPQNHYNHNSNGGSVYYTPPPRSPAAYEGWSAKEESAISRQNQQHGGLAALAMHAARIRPMSPLGNKSKTKSELESALGPSPSTSYPR
ncbi:hypothetical protein BU17DRAFT_80474 [Hysterangium stoloniferum]|nr:hypothetical protein BU17DRAFT_80474 [Hysterangium stoloniferum]